jgi:hypothetical protein
MVGAGSIVARYGLRLPPPRRTVKRSCRARIYVRTSISVLNQNGRRGEEEIDRVMQFKGNYCLRN